MTPTTPRRPDRDPDDWLDWQPEGSGHDTRSDSPEPDGVGADAVGADPSVGTTGPWLRHDVDPTQPPAAGPVSPWLAAEVSVPESAPTEDRHDTGVPPTLAEHPATEHPATEHPATEQPAAPAEPAGRRAPTAQPPAAAPTEALPVAAADAGHAAYGDDPGGHDPHGDLGAPVTGPRSRAHARPRDERPPAGALGVLGAAVKEFAIVVGMALVLSFVVKTWLLQAFYIPSGSMEDTLRVNDRVIVSKLTPGPFELRRGDIIVFGDPGDWLEPPVEETRGTVATVVRDTLIFVGLLPDDAENHLIKRVIGLPGDRVVCCDKGGRLTVNGQAIKEPYLKPGVAPSDQDFDITVPRGRVWVMGDNRSGSSDSRAHDGPDNDGRLGSVDERLIVGRAVALVWPLDHLTWLSNPSSVFRDVPAPKPAAVVEDTPQEDTGTDVPTDGGG